MSHNARKQYFRPGWAQTGGTNQPEQPQQMARSLKFQTEEEGELYYLRSKNKGADQLCCY